MNEPGRKIEIRCSAGRGACGRLLATVTVGSWDVDAPGQPEFEKDRNGKPRTLHPRPVCSKHGRRAPVDLLHLVDNDFYKAERLLDVDSV